MQLIYLPSTPLFIAGFFNLLLGCEYVPPHLSVARLTFIPKTPSASKPEDFRPISVEPILLRCLHKVLSLRWMPLFPLERSQFGFLQRDGCYEATSLLHSLLRYSHSNCKDLSNRLDRHFQSFRLDIPRLAA